MKNNFILSCFLCCIIIISGCNNESVNAVENQWIGYNGEVEFDNKNDEFTIYTL